MWSLQKLLTQNLLSSMSFKGLQTPFINKTPSRHTKQILTTNIYNPGKVSEWGGKKKEVRDFQEDVKNMDKS